jgi:hypothetical protein
MSDPSKFVLIIEDNVLIRLSAAKKAEYRVRVVENTS